MTKGEAFKQFTENYSKLSDRQRQDFSRLALKFLDETYLVREKPEDKKDYLQAQNMISVLRAYFSFIDFSLYTDTDKGVIYIRSDVDSNRLKLKKLETITLFILRSIYYDESGKASLTADITATMEAIVSEIAKTEIYPNFTSPTLELKNALKTLKRYKVIDFDGDLSDGSTVVRIYKSIMLVVDTESLDGLMKRLSEYKGGPSDETDTENEAD